MAILAAPYLDKKLPAQVGGTFSIPFTLNRAVGINDVNGLQLMVKTISTNIVKATVKTMKENIHLISNDLYEAIFSINEGDFQPGQFYKAQIAFINKNREEEDIGDFSTVGIFKYTCQPEIKILDAENEKELEQFKTNSGKFLGSFKTEDRTEKVAEYKFTVYDENEKLFYSTDFLIHNVANDKNDKQSIDYFYLPKELKAGKNYSIVYTIKTINDLIISTPKIYFLVSLEASSYFPGILKIRTDNDDGYFSLYAVFSESKNYSGSFRILRSSNESNYTEWNIMKQVSFANKNLVPGNAIELFKDFTIKQGIKYKYALQQYSKNFSTRKNFFRIENVNGIDVPKEEFEVKFEDILLYDGERQLKVRYNPKVSSFKNTILENKVDTIGNRYPFFFRNGSVNYKEFPISGLISYNMDENEFFFKWNKDNGYTHRQSTYSWETGNDEGFSTNLTFNNISKEREFKLEVLNWLSDGEFKLFRSPTEGNYIIRLMNVSLTPIDTLGRMLHSFSATAYECADYTYENLVKYKFAINDIQYFEDTKYEVIDIPGKREIEIPNAISARLVDLIPGTEIKLTYSKGNSSHIVIGYTGQYNINIEKDNPLTKINIFYSCDNPTENGFIEYAYIERESSKNIYDKDNNKIEKFEINSFIEQFIGPCNIYSEIIKNDNEKLETMPVLTIHKKLIEEAWTLEDEQKNIKLFYDATFKYPINPLSTSLYHSINNNLYYSYNNNKLIEIIPDYNYIIDNNNFNLASGYINYSFDEKSSIYFLSIGNGLYVDSYYTKSIFKRSDDSK